MMITMKPQIPSYPANNRTQRIRHVFYEFDLDEKSIKIIHLVKLRLNEKHVYGLYVSNAVN